MSLVPDPFSSPVHITHASTGPLFGSFTFACHVSTGVAGSICAGRLFGRQRIHASVEWTQ